MKTTNMNCGLEATISPPVSLASASAYVLHEQLRLLHPAMDLHLAWPCNAPIHSKTMTICNVHELPHQTYISLFPVCHYERCSIPTYHQKIHTDSGAMTLNSFIQHVIPSPFCLVLTVWQLLHVGPGKKNVHVALSVAGICGGCVDRYWSASPLVSHSLFSLDSLSSLTLAVEKP